MLESRLIQAYRVHASFMSTDDHSPTHPNDLTDLTEDANLGARDHVQSNGVAIMTAVTANPPNSVPPHIEDPVFDEVMINNASISPPVQPIPQTVPLDDKTEPKLGDDEAAVTVGGDPDSQSEETKGEEDGKDEYEDGDDDEDEDEEDDDDDDDDEPALKYERFGGAFQDLLKKDSASALAVSNKFLVDHVVIAQCLLLTLVRRRLVRTMVLYIFWT